MMPNNQQFLTLLEDMQIALGDSFELEIDNKAFVKLLNLNFVLEELGEN